MGCGEFSLFGNLVVCGKGGVEIDGLFLELELVDDGVVVGF